MKILFQKNEFDPKTHLFQDILSIGVLKICQWTLYESPTPHSWPVYVHMKFDRTTADVNHVTSNRRKIAFAPREHLHTRHRGNQQIPAKIICQTDLTKIHGQAPWWWNTKSCLIKKNPRMKITECGIDIPWRTNRFGDEFGEHVNGPKYGAKHCSACGIKRMAINSILPTSDPLPTLPTSPDSTSEVSWSEDKVKWRDVKWKRTYIQATPFRSFYLG